MTVKEFKNKFQEISKNRFYIGDGTNDHYKIEERAGMACFVRYHWFNEPVLNNNRNITINYFDNE